MKFAKGFTLVELMIAVVIVSIIAAIAVPAYSNYVKRGKIGEATSNLAGERVRLEQYYQDNRTYGSTATSCGTSASLPAPPKVQYFTFSCNWGPNGNNDQTYTITATGTGSMQGFTYTIDQGNNKQTTAVPPGWGTAPVNCWVLKEGGAC